jgi:uncharacterized protein YoxC
MQVLTVLTLILAVVVVVAVAVSLIAILILLSRVGTTLAEVNNALSSVPGDTAPLEGVLQAVRDTAAQVARDVNKAQSVFQKLYQQLGAIAWKSPSR